MDSRYKRIWASAVPFLKKGKRKDFVLHTRNVEKAVVALAKKEKGDLDLLVPAAILHDVGWAKVPLKIQTNRMKKSVKMRCEKLHLEYGADIIRRILSDVGYQKLEIKKIISIVKAHKFVNPRNLNKRLLIDADNLSDSYKEQFYSDAKAYGVTPQMNYKWRIESNNFYTDTAREIFRKEMSKRKSELGI